MTGHYQKRCRRHLIRSVRLLEGLCARWATEHITEEQIEELEEMLTSVRISSET